MSRMLNFFEAGWAAARDHALAGRRQESLAALMPLLRGTDAPGRLTLSAHRLAARLYFADARYKLCRKHLRIAYKLDPKNHEIAFELAQAWERDPAGSDRRALCWFREAARLSATPKNLAALGRSQIRGNQVNRGCRNLLRAAQKAPTELFVLQCAVDGLRDAGRPRTAFRLVSQALFLAPRSTEIRALWLSASVNTKLKKKPLRSASLLPFTAPTTVGPLLRLHTNTRLSRPHFLRLHG